MVIYVVFHWVLCVVVVHDVLRVVIVYDHTCDIVWVCMGKVHNFLLPISISS